MAQSADIPAAEPVSKTRHARLAWRTWVPWALVVLAAVIGLVSALNVWVKRQALSTDNWTQASSQLLENDKIRGALSVYLVDQLYTNVDVAGRLEQRLPPQFKGFAPPLAAALQDVAVRRANTLFGRPKVSNSSGNGWGSEESSPSGSLLTPGRSRS